LQLPEGTWQTREHVYSLNGHLTMFLWACCFHVLGSGLVHCSVKNAAVLCENHLERVTQILNSPSEVEEEEGERKTFWPSGDFLVRYFRDAF